MVDITGSSNYQSDYGDLKAGTNDFRRKLWSTFVEETDAYSPLFGRGFGYNFVTHFEDLYHLSEAGQLRSAHNFYVTLYGRMGWTGIAVFAVLTLQIIVGGIRAALMVKADKQPLVDLGYWCATWVILVSSAVSASCSKDQWAPSYFGLCWVLRLRFHSKPPLLNANSANRRMPEIELLPTLPARRAVVLRHDPGSASAFAVNFQQPREVLLPRERCRLPSACGDQRFMVSSF